jgi:hypothetical protein
VAVSFGLYFMLPDNPETASFLTKAEKEFIINRLALDTGSKASKAGRVTNNDKIGMHHIKAAFKDWRTFSSLYYLLTRASLLFLRANNRHQQASGLR